MFGFTHLLDNSLLGFILLSVLTIFLVSVLVSIAACFRPTLAPGSQNFTYVATAIAGLVLSVASGVLGKPTTVELSKSPSIQSSATEVSLSSVQANISNNQIGNFQQLYAWAYVLAGLLCLTIFVMPTPGNQDLVKNVALTTLGFLITIVGTLTAQSPAAIQRATQTVVKEVVSRSNALF